jgi:SAM-dependent methyltransferase
MIQKINNFVKKQSFQPNIFSIVLNPFVFIRWGIFRKVQLFAPKLSGVLLDFGCGRKPYKNLFTVEKYIGLDLEKTGHDHTESEVDVFYDGKRIPFEDNYFDSVFTSEVFEHVFNLDEVLLEIRRVMKPNGQILLTIPFAWGEHEKPYDFARYTSFAIKHILEKNGFEVVAQEKSGHWVEVLIQLWTGYIYTLFQTKSRSLNIVLTAIFISPFNVAGILLSLIMPKSKDLYHNNVVLAKKCSEVKPA